MSYTLTLKPLKIVQGR